MNPIREGRAYARDTIDHRTHDAAVALTEVPGVISAILGEDGIYIVRFDRSRVTDDALLATMDRQGLEVVAWDDLRGDSDPEARAEDAAGTTASVAGGAAKDTIAVLLRGGPLDGESRLVRHDALLIDEPLTIVRTRRLRRSGGAGGGRGHGVPLSR